MLDDSAPFQMKISAIHQGCDWNDATADYLIIPEGINVREEERKRSEWWKSVWGDKTTQYLNLKEWLLKIPGVREPTKDELEIHDLT